MSETGMWERQQMSPEFVRYAPEIETINPHIDELLAQILDFVEERGS
jgi:hypothetical protein